MPAALPAAWPFALPVASLVGLLVPVLVVLVICGRLRRLHGGDKIVVVLADGSRRLVLVDSLTIWPARTAPPGMGEPYGPPRLTLITCTGPFDDHYKTFADRLAVEASYAGLA